MNLSLFFRIAWSLVKIWAIAANLIREFFRRKEFYVILVLLGILLFFSASINFFAVEEISRYFKEIGLALAWLFSLIVLIPLASRQIPQEQERKTIYPLLAKPVKRIEFIVGKFLGSGLAAIASFTIFYLAIMLSSFFRGEFAPLLLWFQGYTLHILSLSIIASMVIFLSLFINRDTNIVFSFLVYFAISWFGISIKEIAEMGGNALTSSLGQSLYYLLPHFEFFDLRTRIIHLWPPVPGRIICFLIVYSLGWTILFLYLAWWKFHRRRL